MKARLEKLRRKICQLPTEEQSFIRQLIEVVEREVDRKLMEKSGAVKWCGKGKHFVLRSNFYARKNGLRAECKDCGYGKKNLQNL